MSPPPFLSPGSVCSVMVAKRVSVRLGNALRIGRLWGAAAQFSQGLAVRADVLSHIWISGTSPS